MRTAISKFLKATKPRCDACGSDEVEFYVPKNPAEFHNHLKWYAVCGRQACMGEIYEMRALTLAKRRSEGR